MSVCIFYILAIIVKDMYIEKSSDSRSDRRIPKIRGSTVGPRKLEVRLSVPNI